MGPREVFTPNEVDGVWYWLCSDRVVWKEDPSPAVVGTLEAPTPNGTFVSRQRFMCTD